MAYVTENSEWAPEIYLIQTTDAPTGGQNGICNIQATQLGSRTLFLRNLFNKGHSEWDTHNIVVDEIADDTDTTNGINELSFNFSESTENIHNEATNYKEAVEEIKEQIKTISGEGTSPIFSIYRALIASWRYIGLGIDICLFTKEFNFVDTKEYNVSKTINLDDSIDVEEGTDTSNIQVGEFFSLMNKKTGEFITVTIKDVLDNGRILVSPDLTFTSKDEYKLSKNSVELHNKYAEAKQGTYLYTVAITSLKGLPSGHLDIVHDGTPDAFTVKYADNVAGPWKVLALENSSINSRGHTVSTYLVDGADKIYFYLYANEDDRIDSISIYGDIESIYNNFIRTPKIQNPYIISRYGALYRDSFDYLEIQLGTDSGFANSKVFRIYGLTFDDQITKSVAAEIHTEADSYLHDYNVWRARYASSEGHISNYSNILPIV